MKPIRIDMLQWLWLDWSAAKDDAGAAAALGSAGHQIYKVKKHLIACSTTRGARTQRSQPPTFAKTSCAKMSSGPIVERERTERPRAAPLT